VLLCTGPVLWTASPHKKHWMAFKSSVWKSEEKNDFVIFFIELNWVSLSCMWWARIISNQSSITRFSGFVQTTESPEINVLRFLGMESPGKGIGPGKRWKVLEFYSGGPAPPAAWSASSPWYDLHIIRRTACLQWGKIFFGISVVTFEVSGCTEFLIFHGSAPDSAGGACRPRKCVLWVLVNPGSWTLQVLESPGKLWFNVCTNPVLSKCLMSSLLSLSLL